MKTVTLNVKYPHLKEPVTEHHTNVNFITFEKHFLCINKKAKNSYIKLTTILSITESKDEK